ncbi:odorant receptor 4-like isoform X1 [Ceratina calcarata]|uniref:Odorant receptor n=2 Tax=Ceratina calcarata TaxID=156304 RepID=A0AAJ7S317_9HYME|nr:odorant receptor 4-like isoform X1 [Ceratina calcarata]XP_026670016.1 odorant receptor 4-like isoform X1 [Ceratina calcarata]
MFNVTTGRLFYILELAGTFTCTWPVDVNSSKSRILIRNIRWSFAMLNVTLLLTSLVLAVYHFREDTTTVMKTASEMTALLEVFLDLIFCKLKSAQLQVLITRIRGFVEVANEDESRVLQGYVDRYKMFFSVTAMGYISTAVSFGFVPLFSTQDLPADGWIPFATEPLVLYLVIYVHQVYCICTAALCIFVDFTIALLFSFPAARLDILGTKLRHVDSYRMLISCVKEHQEIIGFVEDTKAIVEALLFKTNVTMGSAVICGAFQLVNNQSLAVKSQFVPMVVSGCAHLYVIAWPADDLKESSVRFLNSIADVRWLGKQREMGSALIIMIQRSQKMFLIRMSSLLPALTLEYYANFLTTVSSYFMAMRTMIES